MNIVGIVGKYVDIKDFTKDELQQVEDKLKSLGYNAYDLVEHHYGRLTSLGKSQKYGVDTDNDIVFAEDTDSLAPKTRHLTREEYLNLIGLTLEPSKGESEMDLRGKCVRVDAFTLEELYKVEKRLKELGVRFCETVNEDLADVYQRGYYGVDAENDTMFYNNVGCYGLDNIEDEELTRKEFLEMIGLDLSPDTTTEPPCDGHVLPLNKLYKVVADNGRTYYFDSDTALKAVIRAENIGDARADLAAIIISERGVMIKNIFTHTQLVEAKFDIEEV